MRALTAFFLFVFFISTTTAQEQEAAPDPEKTWYLQVYGNCIEAQNPGVLLLFYKNAGAKPVAKDVSEKGKIVATTLTLTDPDTHKKEQLDFFRGKDRCHKAIEKLAKKAAEGVKQYE